NGITRAPDEIVTTIWRNGKTLPLDLKSALISSDAAANVPLQSNDILQLKPPESIQVQMMGQVAKPQTLSLPTDAHMLDAIVQAGGLTIKPEDARIKVLRNLPNGEWKELNVDPKELIELSAAQNIALRPNDFISVTPLEQEIKKVRVFVRGQVTKPGPYELNADTASLRELLIQ